MRAKASKVPLTADIEGGYTDDLATLAETIKAVIGAGAVGINLEDGSRSPRPARPQDRGGAQGRRTQAGRRPVHQRPHRHLSEGPGPGRGGGDRDRQAAPSSTRAAGASGIFVPGPNDSDLIGRLAKAIALPLNVMSRGGVPDGAKLQALGVRRLSSATGLFNAAYTALIKATEAFLQERRPRWPCPAGGGVPNLNKRFG